MRTKLTLVILVCFVQYQIKVGMRWISLNVWAYPLSISFQKKGTEKNKSLSNLRGTHSEGSQIQYYFVLKLEEFHFKFLAL